MPKSSLPRQVVPFLISQTLDATGRQVFLLAMIWLVTGVTHSAGRLGVFFALIELPYLALLIPAGTWADRTDRKRLALRFTAIRVLVLACLALGLRLAHVPWLLVAGFAVVQEATTAIVVPSLSPWMMSLVDADLFGVLNAWGQTGSQAATVLGPAVGGFLVSLVGIPGAVGFAAVMALTALVGRTLTPRPRTSGEAHARRERGFWAGWRFLSQQRGMLYMVLFFSLTNGLNNVEAVLVPVLSRSLLHLPAWQFGALATGFGGGAIAGAWLGVRVDQHARRRIPSILASMIVFGLTIVAMGAAPNVLWLAAAYVVAGVAFATGEVASSTLWQRMIPDDRRGRVLSTMSTLARAVNPLGFILAGWLGVVVGVRAGLFIGGAAIILLTGLLTLVRAVRQLDSNPLQPRVDPVA